MGMNQRNVSYIGRYNPRSLYPLVDNKLKTKRIAVDAGVTVPKLIGTVQHQHEVTKIAGYGSKTGRVLYQTSSWFRR